MQSRFLKQLIYGAFYLVIIFGLGYGIYASVLQGPASCFDNRENQGEEEVDCGGPCPSCELKRLKPIQVSPVAIFDIGNGQLSALVELRNPNVSYGANRFSYKLSFYNAAGSEVSSVVKDSFIYPGEIKYIVEAGLNINPREVSRAEARLTNFSWKSIQEFSLPKAQTRAIKVEIKQGETKAVVSGIDVNKNYFSIA